MCANSTGGADLAGGADSCHQEHPQTGNLNLHNTHILQNSKVETWSTNNADKSDFCAILKKSSIEHEQKAVKYLFIIDEHAHCDEHLPVSERVASILWIDLSCPANEKKLLEVTQIIPAEDTEHRQEAGIPPPPNPSEDIRLLHEKLPVFAARDAILGAVSRRTVCIVTSTTGSGKSTLVPQMLLEEASECEAPCNVICAEPRRLAAKELARRVAIERSDELGNVVGYQLRHDSRVSVQTRLRYTTYGTLLVMMKAGINFSHIILDEAHERTTECDMILLVFKQLALTKKINSKLIVMSATLNLKIVENYFPKSITVKVPGESPFDVEIKYLNDVLTMLGYLEQDKDEPARKSKRIGDMDYPLIEQLIMRLIEDAAGAAKCVLIFLPGLENILALEALLSAKLELKHRFLFDIFKLHSSFKLEEQEKLFSSRRKIKVVLATNIAESSITIPDVTDVIDMGREKVASTDNNGIKKLELQWISQARATQRAGRAGRVQSGVCYRLYTKSHFEAQCADSVPEIQRSNLTKFCLDAITLKQESQSVADFFSQAPEPPSQDQIDRGLSVLSALGAMTQSEKLTFVGQSLAALSISPTAAKSILLSCYFKCVEPVLIMCCALEQKNLIAEQYENDTGKNRAKKQEMAEGSCSDHYFLYKLFDQYWKGGDAVKQYLASKLSMSELNKVDCLKQQIERQLKALGLVNGNSNENSSSWIAIKASLVGGHVTQVSRVVGGVNLVTKNGMTARLQDESQLLTYPSKGKKESQSTLKFAIYDSLQWFGKRLVATCCTPVTGLMIFLMAGPTMLKVDDTVATFDGWLKFDLKEDCAKGIVQLQEKLHSSFNHFLVNPTTAEWRPIFCALEVLGFEEEILKIKIPSMSKPVNKDTAPQSHASGSETVSKNESVEPAAESLCQHEGTNESSDSQGKADATEVVGPPKNKRKRSDKLTMAEEKLSKKQPLDANLQAVKDAKTRRRSATNKRVQDATSELGDYRSKLLAIPEGHHETLKDKILNDIWEIEEWLNTKGVSHSAEEVASRLVNVRGWANTILAPQNQV